MDTTALKKVLGDCLEGYYKTVVTRPFRSSKSPRPRQNGEQANNDRLAPLHQERSLKLDTISNTIIEVRVIVEGALSLYEKNPKPDADTYSLIGEALHMIQERISYCVLACQNDAHPRQNC